MDYVASLSHWITARSLGLATFACAHHFCIPTSKKRYIRCVFICQCLTYEAADRKSVFFQLLAFCFSYFFLFGWRSDLLHPYSTSFTGTRVNCCLTCAVTLPHAICIPLSQIHYYTIPLVGKGFAMCQPRPRSRREIHKPCVGAGKGGKKKKKGLHQCLLIW